MDAREAAWDKARCKRCETCQFEGDGSCDDYGERWFKAGYDAALSESKAEIERLKELLTGCEALFIRCGNAWHGGDEEPNLADDVDAMRRRVTRILRSVGDEQVIEFDDSAKH